MYHFDSITTRVQMDLESRQEDLIASGNEILDRQTSESITDFLEDSKTLNTFGFLLRRSIQVRFPEWFEKFEKCEVFTEELLEEENAHKYADLTQNGNVPWPEKILQALGTKLYSLGYKNHKVEIQKSLWVKYMTDTQIPGDRETVYKIAFIIGLDLEETMHLFLSLGMNRNMTRNPFDYICCYCMQRKVDNWSSVMALWQEYAEKYMEQMGENISDSSGEIFADLSAASMMTQYLEKEQNKILTGPSQEKNKDLIEFMLENVQEFTPLYAKRKKGRKAKSSEGHKYVSDDGYSLTDFHSFCRLLQYLVVLYPNYTAAQKRGEIDLNTEIHKDKFDYMKEYPIPVSEDGYPDVTILIQVMMNERSLEVERRKDGKEYKGVLARTVSNYLDGFLGHMEQVAEGLKENVVKDTIDRRDVLLLAYCFIVAYLEETSRERIDKLMEMTEQEDADEADEYMRRIMEMLDGMDVSPEEDYLDSCAYYRKCLNEFLELFHQLPFYVPNAFDRFILIALLFSAKSQVEDSDNLISFMLNKY